MENHPIMIYNTADGQTKIELKVTEDTAWLSQMALAELFETTKNNISLHIKNIFMDGELDKKTVVKDYLTTASDGKKYKIAHYNSRRNLSHRLSRPLKTRGGISPLDQYYLKRISPKGICDE